jgi:hypothetical protein
MTAAQFGGSPKRACACICVYDCAPDIIEKHQLHVVHCRLLLHCNAPTHRSHMQIHATPVLLRVQSYPLRLFQTHVWVTHIYVAPLLVSLPSTAHGTAMSYERNRLCIRCLSRRSVKVYCWARGRALAEFEQHIRLLRTAAARARRHVSMHCCLREESVILLYSSTQP